MSDTPKKPRLPRYNSPIGVAVFPRLTEPDFKFKKDHGEFSVKLRLPEAEARKILAAAEAVAEESYREKAKELDGTLDKKGQKIVVIKADPAWELVLDDNKQPTGDIIIAFKMAGGYTDKNEVKIKKAVPMFDAAGNPVKLDIWGGSKLKVQYELAPYYAAADRKAGCSFRLLAVQIIKLVTRGSGDASQFGFKAEDGFVAEPQMPETKATEGTGDAKAKGDF